jgi:hypothetical protein
MGEIEVQAAFAGHRRAGDVGDRSSLERKLAAAFDILKEAGVTNARLLVGLAEGADEMAAEAWRRAAMGPVHAVLPFLHEGVDEVGEGHAAQSGTWLDGAASERAGVNPHLAQTRWLLGQADLLIAVWSGRARRGAGGTADAIRLALEAGIPILWINPREQTPRLIPPLRLHHLADVVEVMQSLPTATAPMVAAVEAAILKELLDLGPRPAGEAPREHRLDAFLTRWLWRTFALFQRAVGGRSRAGPGREAPADLAAQPGFQVISAALAAADRRANHLSAVHRSEQILLLAAAVLASVIGASPVFLPGLKLEAVIGELTVGVFAFGVWWAAQRSRQHEGWTTARRQAEQLRLNRASWALGTSTRRVGSPSMRHEHQSLARPVLRQAPPPLGAYDAARIAQWTPWAMHELVVGQADYHALPGSRTRRISRRVSAAADAGFVVVLAGLAATAALAAAPASVKALAPAWLGAAAIAAGVVVPAVAAACMALEAKLQFDEQAERSAALVGRLRALAREVGPAPSLEQAQGAFREAAEWLLAEADQWREGAGRRRLSRGA